MPVPSVTSGALRAGAISFGQMDAPIVSSDTKVVTFAPVGSLSRQTIVHLLDEHYPEIGDRQIMWDLRHASLDGVSPQDFADIGLAAKRLLSHRSGRRTAYVVASADTHVRICKYLNEAFRARLPAEYAVFYAVDEARRWLSER